MAQDLNVSMKLVLVDTASAQLKNFLNQLQGVQQTAPGINRSLGTLNSRLETTGKNAQKAATGVNSLLAMLTAADGALRPLLGRFNALVNELRGVNQQAGNSARAMGKLEMNMQATAGNAQRLVVPLQDVNAELQSMATHAAQAGTHLGTVNGQMRGMGNQAQRTTQHVNTLADSLKGVAKLWGALKIEEGLKASGKEGVAYENTRYRLDNLNLGPANNKTMIDASNAASRAVPQFDRDHMLTLALDLHNATGSVKDAAEMLKDFATAEYAMKRGLPKDSNFTDRDMLSVAKFLEQRGATQDMGRMRDELDMVSKIISTTQGRVNPAQLLGNIQYSKFNLGQTMDLGFMPIFAAMIERSKAGSGSGGTVGTALTSLLQTVVGGHIQHQLLPEWSKMGMIHKDKVELNDNGTVKKIDEGAVVGADLFLKNPYLWIQQVLLPAMQRAGVNIRDDKAVVQKMSALFGNRNAAQVAGTMATQQQFLEKDAGNITNSRGYQQQYDAAIKTATSSLDTIKNRLSDLGVVIGSKLLPLFEPLLKAVAAFVKDLVDFASNHQIIAAFTAIGAGISGIVMAISGVKNVFGVVGKLSEALTGMGGAAKGASAAMQTTVGPAQLMSKTLGYGSGGAAAAARTAGGTFTRMSGLFRAAGGVITTTCGVIARGMLRLIPIVGQIAMVYSLADVIAHLKMGGVEIITWVIGWGDTFLTTMSNAWVRIENAAKSAWSRIKSVFTGGAAQSYDAATKATIDANNRALEQRLKANGMTRTGLMTIGADPKPKAAVPNVNPNGHTRATYAPSPDLQTPFDIQKHKKGKKAGAGRHYNPEASEAQQDYRLEEDALKDHLDSIKKLYDAGKMSIADYYKQKLNYTNQGIDLEIKALQKEKAALEKDPKANKNRIDRLNTDIQLKEREKARQARDIEAAQQKDLNDLKEKEVALDEKLLELQGKTAEAKAMKQSHRADKAHDEFARNGMNEAANTANTVKQIEAAQTQLAVLQEEIKNLEELEQLAEQKIDNAVKAGTMTSFDAENQKDALRRGLAAQVTARLPAMQAAAAGTQNQDTINQVAQQGEAAKGTLQQLTPMAQNLMNVTQNAMTGLFEGLTKSHMHLQDLLGQTWRSIAQGIDGLVSKILAQKVAAELFGVDQNGNSTGQGIGSLFASLFGGSGTTGTSGSSSAGTANAFAAIISKFVGGSFASGIDYVPHDMLAIIHEGERVVPRHMNNNYDSQRQRAVSSGGQQTNHFNFVIPPGTNQQTQHQLATSAAIGMQRAIKRNG